MDDLNKDVPVIHAHMGADGEARFGEGDGYTDEEIIDRVKDSLDNPDGVTDMDDREVYPVPGPERFVDGRTGYVSEFIDAPDLAAIGAQLIEAFDLYNAETSVIKYRWKDKGTAEATGKCIRANGLLRHETRADFVIWVGAEDCLMNEFTFKQIRALLYHELLHVSKTEKGKPAVKRHDAEVFRDELKHFGLWNASLKHVFGQLEFKL